MSEKNMRELSTIFHIRALLLREMNPRFYTQNADIIFRSSLAAQDYVMSGTYAKEHTAPAGRQVFKTLPGYIAIHQKYNLPYNPSASVRESTVLHPGLVMDLAWAFTQDLKTNIIDAQGDVNVARLAQSEVLAVYHNTPASGVPVEKFHSISLNSFSKLMMQTNQYLGQQKQK